MRRTIILVWKPKFPFEWLIQAFPNCTATKSVERFEITGKAWCRNMCFQNLKNTINYMRIFLDKIFRSIPVKKCPVAMRTFNTIVQNLGQFSYTKTFNGFVKIHATSSFNGKNNILYISYH